MLQENNQEQKEWQKGYNLDYLVSLESRFASHNLYALSPFQEIKKNTIATLLDEDRLVINATEAYSTYICKVKSAIKMYQNVVIAEKLPGDRVVENIGNIENNTLKSFKENTWIILFEENAELVDKVMDHDFKKIGVKITSFGEMLGIYFRDRKGALEDRDHPVISPYEYYGLGRTMLNWKPELATSILAKLNGLTYTNHYSNYNKDKSWSAFSLRGYSADPAFITKPSEMNDKWKEENKHLEFGMQDTPLRKEFPEVENILSFYQGPIHRIRFMKLKPGGGELTRHTDQVDKDTGVNDGQLMRFHFPIKTNPDVRFSIIDYTGFKKTATMQVGECWFLDTRHPHMAINGGAEERIHLVVDLEANDVTRGILR